MQHKGMAHTREDLQEELVLETTDQLDLVVHNDDVNTFDHVIISLMEICGHDPIQAEQCAWIIHNNGKCSVKRGTMEHLGPMCTALHDRGISADIR